MVARAQKQFERHLVDTCVKGTVSNGGWGSAPTGESVSYGSAIACFLDLNQPTETTDGSDTTVVDGLCYLPAGTTWAAGNPLKLTHRDRTALSPNEVYRVLGEPLNARTGLVLRVQRADGGAVV